MKYLKNGIPVNVIQQLKSRWIVEPVIEYELSKGVTMKVTAPMIVVEELFDESIQVEEKHSIFTRELAKNQVEIDGCIVEKTFSGAYQINFNKRFVNLTEVKNLPGVQLTYDYEQDYVVGIIVALTFDPEQVIKKVIEIINKQ